ncbi:MAG: chorismate synthase, partial [Pseudomonadota bacterium]
FGHLFRVTTWGESHGPAIGCVVDGCPPGLPLTEEDIQADLDRRRPGTSKFVTQRREPDKVKILSGVFEDDRTGGPVTTGTPISLMIENIDQRSRDYSDIRDTYRPGHADYTYDAKYGVRDYRGGGRSSARETAMRVAAGAIAKKILGDKISIRARITQIGTSNAGPAKDWSIRNSNPFFATDPDIIPVWEDYLDQIRKSGSSVGARVEVEAEGLPAGWGAPVYGKLDAEIAAALMSINAAKGVEIGSGFASIEQSGEASADVIQRDGEDLIFSSNNNGGVLGGISTGQAVIARLAIKPTSSILTPVKTVNKAGDNTVVSTKGRHDPCVGLRAVPVVEAMVACVLADALLRHRAQNSV